MRSHCQDHTYTLSDLDDWAFAGVSLAVLGHPVQHSVSPQMHNAAIAALAPSNPKLANWKYFKFDVNAKDLPTALPRFHEKGFHGLNLTVPHKEIAFGIIEQVEENARQVGAVNTLLRSSSGYEGYNTDGYGLSEGAKRSLGQAIGDSNIVLLGAGGAARAAAMQCLAESCNTLTIINRNQERLQKLVADISDYAQSKNVPLASHPPSQDFKLPPKALIINATSLGLKSDDPSPLLSRDIPDGSGCFDMIYNPSTTKLMEWVASNGGHLANGLSMLVHQGAKSLEIWSGVAVPPEIMMQAATNALSS